MRIGGANWGRRIGGGELGGADWGFGAILAERIACQKPKSLRIKVTESR